MNKRRVGAILRAKEGRVDFFGYGNYVGDELPIGALGMGESLVGAGIRNPKIELDNGQTVWGCECWWGSEEAVAEKIELYRNNGYEIVAVPENWRENKVKAGGE